MTIRVIGAGWSRTGTFSLKRALERVGFGPCYHMHEVFAHPEHVALWEAADRGEPVDWHALLSDYAAVSDAPACTFWRELCGAFPEARVILTVRDAREWYASMRSTVVQIMTHPPSGLDARVRRVLEMARQISLERFFQGAFDDRERAIALFQRHNDDVRGAIPPGRLLVYDVASGWEPLCRFLDVPVPQQPFPVTNERASFRQRSGLP
jgi:hypothetical protein